MKKKIAMIGCGGIAEFHAKAFQAAGLDIVAVAGKKNSDRANIFAKKYKIRDVWQNPLDLAKQKSPYINGFLIAIPIDDKTTLKYLKIISKNNMPALFEKPLVVNYQKLQNLNYNKDNIVLGYNRRFYKSIQMAREFIKKNQPLLVQVEVPEYQNIKANKNFENLFTNSIHIIDVLRYLFGDLKIVSKSKIFLKKNYPIIALCRSKKNDLLSLTFNFNASSNFNIKIDSNDHRFHLQPIEIANIYKGIKKLSAIGKNTISQYKPVLTQKNITPKYEINFKPGFYLQAKEFKDIINNKKRKISANIDDAIKNLIFIENLIK